MERAKTISKHFYDDEILYKDQTTGEIHLKMGVRRSPQPSTDYTMEDEYINYDVIRSLKTKEYISKLIGEPLEDSRDNWDTE